MSTQLPLALNLKDGAVFANFVTGPNQEAVTFLQNATALTSTPLVYLWGDAGCGKSHLLQALCQAASDCGQAAVYLPMRMLVEYPREALNDLEQMAVIAIDDIDTIAGSVEWEDALLRLFVRAHDASCRLVLAADKSVKQLELKLPQLESRLHWGMAFSLQPLSDSDKLSALELRAKRRGCKLPPESARYLLRHYGTDTEQLFGALERLDQASLAAKRRLTIPFIRFVLRQNAAD